MEHIWLWFDLDCWLRNSVQGHCTHISTEHILLKYKSDQTNLLKRKRKYRRFTFQKSAFTLAFVFAFSQALCWKWKPDKALDKDSTEWSIGLDLLPWNWSHFKARVKSEPKLHKFKTLTFNLESLFKVTAFSSPRSTLWMHF